MSLQFFIAGWSSLLCINKSHIKLVLIRGENVLRDCGIVAQYKSLLLFDHWAISHGVVFWFLIYHSTFQSNIAAKIRWTAKFWSIHVKQCVGVVCVSSQWCPNRIVFKAFHLFNCYFCAFIVYRFKVYPIILISSRIYVLGFF